MSRIIWGSGIRPIFALAVSTKGAYADLFHDPFAIVVTQNDHSVALQSPPAIIPAPYVDCFFIGADEIGEPVIGVKYRDKDGMVIELVLGKFPDTEWALTWVQYVNKFYKEKGNEEAS
jgi:hypothetical protein